MRVLPCVLAEPAAVTGLSEKPGEPIHEKLLFWVRAPCGSLRHRWIFYPSQWELCDLCRGIKLVMLQKIISGGQTGVDRAALDVGLEFGIPVGGYCPKGRRSEDGTIPDQYPLVETNTSNYGVRTEKNVVESDGTLILNVGQPSSGTAYTIKMAKRHKKPFLVVQLDQETNSETVLHWLVTNKIRVLNVAGPRESKIPGIHKQALKFLRVLLAEAHNEKVLASHSE